MASLAVLFDVDGTLVDSNYLHVDAWVRAFARAGHGVDAWRVHRAIGMDSTKLLETLLGERAETLGERAKQLHGEFFEERSSGLTAVNGARELVAEVARRGQKAVLATSAPEGELATLRRVLDVDGDVFATTSSEDVETAKPAPDIVMVALGRAGTRPSDAVFVGDSVWDVEASVRAGVRCVALLSGGTGGRELLDAGAESVWDDPAHLLGHYDEAL